MPKRPLPRRFNMSEKEPLMGDAAIHWLTSNPRDAAFFHLHLRHARFDQNEAKALTPHYEAIANIFNETTIGALYSSRSRVGEVRTGAQFNSRLKLARDALPGRLREQMPDITDAQSAMLVELYEGWRIRVLVYTKHLDTVAKTSAQR